MESILLSFSFAVALPPPPPLASFSPGFRAIQTCHTPSSVPPSSSSAQHCPGYDVPQLVGRVRGDNATLCFHLGCCYAAASGDCTVAPNASATITPSSSTEWFSGNEPIPALSNTRGTIQLPLETSDALAVDCIYFPPFFGTCDGSRSDSRFDRGHDPYAPPINPTFGGATQKLRVNGVSIQALSYRWSPSEIVRRAAAPGLPWLTVNSSVRMVLGQSTVLLMLELTNRGTTQRRANVSFELPFVSRLYPEIDAGYESSSPFPLSPSGQRGAHATNATNASAWRFATTQGGGLGSEKPAVQTAYDTTGPTEYGKAVASIAKACTAAAVSSSLSPVSLTPVAPGSWSRVTMGGVLQPGQRERIEVSLAITTASASGECAAAAAQATAAATGFDQAWSEVATANEARWQAAFDPGEDTIFEGNFPTLESSDAALMKTYYGSLMSMMLVNKRGINTQMEVEETPAPTQSAAAGCEGTYVATVSGGQDVEQASHPFQLHAAGSKVGSLEVEATQYAGLMNPPWRVGRGALSPRHGESGDDDGASFIITMAFDNGTSAVGTVISDTGSGGGGGGNCSRIIWGNSSSVWIRIRPAGKWNMFVAAGALLGNTAFYLWDTSGASLLWSLLAPTSMSTANDAFASNDPLVKNALDYITMSSAGKYYAFSPISAFQALANEVRIGGERAAHRRIALTNRTAVEQLVFIANEYLRLPTFNGTVLSDWGGNPTNFLECQATYLHGIAALQASSVWMLREAAVAIRAVGGNASEADDMEQRASVILNDLLPQLAMGDDGGWWWMLYPPSRGGNSNNSAPTRVEGRFIHDFLYVGQAIAADLSSEQRDGMADFFQRELRTPDFVRAMSQRDPSAASTGSRRADHNQWGSWDGWSGGSITALAHLGRLDDALALARDLGRNLDEGPFGQAHRVFGAGEGPNATMARPSRKDQSWMAVCSGYIADGIIRGLFGYQPDLKLKAGAPPALLAPNAARGFEGKLRHVRYAGALYTITAGASGVRVERE